MPNGSGIISDNEIANIVKAIQGRIETVLLTSETRVKDIIEHHKKVNSSCIQLVDTLTDGSHNEIKVALTNVKLFQVFHFMDENSILEAIEFGTSVDFILLDSGNPNAEVKTLGGTGNTHNWEISKAILKTARVLFFAGGLKKGNVNKAIQSVGSFGLDICSGVRTNGNLDEEKLSDFLKKLLIQLFN